ncbi:MAG: ATP-dependent helicase, partial [Terrimicrobiaceae bacterium]|nr:ATP-dependent helicase [Terrimicrobiaceae bacterium]
MQPAPGTGTGLDFSQSLNPQQLEAVTHPGGPALVIAGAGSGKTRTLTHRVAWLLAQGVRPYRILLLTFTNKAAREMLERVAELVPGAAEGIWGGTFHSVGNRILRRHGGRIGFDSGFTILDRDDAEELIGAAVAAEGLATSDRRFPKPVVLADIFSLAASTTSPLPRILEKHFPWHLALSAQIERAWAAYQLRKRAANAMDFDDLLTRLVELFETCPDVEEACQFDHVLVDEYQDTNHLQAALIERFARRSGNIMVVGDDAQSIYSWRGADFANILAFPERHPNAAVFRIETNYRSVPAILEVANAAIRANTRQFQKKLTAARPPGPSLPALVPLPDNNQQAAFVAQRILDMHHEEGVPLDEIAVLYRAHFHSLEVQLELTRRHIPFAITSGLRFFEQAHVKDAAAFLKFAVNPRDELAFKRIVRLLPGIGDKTAGSLWRQARTLVGESSSFQPLRRL